MPQYAGTTQRACVSRLTTGPSYPTHPTCPAVRPTRRHYSSLLACLLLQPLDVVKTRLQHSPGRTYAVLAAELRAIGRVSELWRGTAATVYRTVPGVGLYFFTLQAIRRAMAAAGMLAEPIPSPLQSLGAGASARMLVTLLTMPLTLVKTRIEVRCLRNGPYALMPMVRVMVETRTRM